MTEYPEDQLNRTISPFWIIGALVVVLILGWLVSREGNRPLKPFRPSATPSAISLNSHPVVVTFEELNTNPRAFLDQRIRVTGDFDPQSKPDCLDYRGPLFRWALLSSDLQLLGLGMERVMRLVPTGTSLTVDGIWRLYQGPIGCGQEVNRSPVWFLQIERIVQPNPLPYFDLAQVPVDGIPPDDTLTTPAAGETAVPQTPGQTTPTSTSAGTPTMTPTTTALFNNLTATVTPSPTISNFLPTATPDGSITATATATSSGNPPPTATVTPTNSANATSTQAPTQPPLGTATRGPSPTPTATSDAYPGPGTPLPTPTPGSY